MTLNFNRWWIAGFLAIVNAIAVFGAGTYYVSPAGNDGANGLSAQTAFRTIHKARDVVRTHIPAMSSNIYINILKGYHFIDSTVTFTAADGGKGNYKVIYQQFDGTPVISGGVLVQNWSQVSGSNQWSAPLNLDKKVRALYINGARAQRARSAGKFSGSASGSDGISTSSAYVQVFQNPSDVEIASQKQWLSIFQCVQDIASSGGSRILTMQQPSFSYAMNSFATARFSASESYYVQNAYELLDQPGEFYFNRTTKRVYYIPRTGENLSQATVIAPNVECLFEIKGSSLDAKVENLEFSGLAFWNASYNLTKNGNSYGYSGYQGPSSFARLPTPGVSKQVNRRGHDVIRGAVRINFADNVNFVQNRFEHLGGCGILADNGVSNCRFEGNIFQDCGSNSITLGHPEHDFYDDYFPQPLYPFAEGQEEAPTNVVIKNNLVRRVSLDFVHVPLFHSFYTDNLEFSHNDLDAAGYCGLNFGWGWDEAAATETPKNNKISFNHLDGAMSHNDLGDGGAIYSLGPEHNTVVEGNYMEFNGTYHWLYGSNPISQACRGFFPDQGHPTITYRNNVYAGTGTSFGTHSRNGENCTFDGFWYTGLWSSDDPVKSQANMHSFSSTSALLADPQAKAIVDNAGLENSYKFLLDRLAFNPDYTIIPVSVERNVRTKGGAVAVDIVNSLMNGAAPAVRFSLPVKSTVAIDLLNSQGRRLVRLFNGRAQAGAHILDLVGPGAGRIPAGSYFVAISTRNASYVSPVFIGR